jgi:hypothetical protein
VLSTPSSTGVVKFHELLARQSRAFSPALSLKLS